jgi:hypothetical protein
MYGIAEIVQRFNVSKRTAITWSKREDFPEPVARLRAGPVWLKRDVERWARKMRKNPG